MKVGRQKYELMDFYFRILVLSKNYWWNINLIEPETVITYHHIQVPFLNYWLYELAAPKQGILSMQPFQRKG